MSDELRDAVRRKLSFTQTLRAVAWSFFGVRKGSEHQNDVDRLNPVHLIIAGIAGAALFIGALVALIHWVVDSGIARG
jgi:Protein of unknown function (DUF2970)